VRYERSEGKTVLMGERDFGGGLTEQVDPTAPDEAELFTTQDRDNARFMGLDGTPGSEAAKGMTDQLAAQLYYGTATGKRGKPTRAYVAAVAALVSDHLRNAHPDPRRWGYCSHRREAFSGQRIGYRVFKPAFTAMISCGLLEEVRGHQQHTEFNGRKVRAWSMATRSRATRALRGDHPSQS
jgi:hypothetical protein